MYIYVYEISTNVNTFNYFFGNEYFQRLLGIILQRRIMSGVIINVYLTS